MRLIASFSSDRVQLARAVDRLGLSPTLAKGKDPLEFVKDEAMLKALAVSGGGNAGRANRSDAEGAVTDALETFRVMNNASDDRYGARQGQSGDPVLQ